jgi:hypothetical protein
MREACVISVPHDTGPCKAILGAVSRWYKQEKAAENESGGLVRGWWWWLDHSHDPKKMAIIR